VTTHLNSASHKTGVWLYAKQPVLRIGSSRTFGPAPRWIVWVRVPLTLEQQAIRHEPLNHAGEAPASLENAPCRRRL